MDAFTVQDLLGKRGEIDACGGLAGLGALAKGTPSTANIRHYAQVVRDASLERQLMAVAGEIVRFVQEPGDTRAKLDRAQTLVTQIAER